MPRGDTVHGGLGLLTSMINKQNKKIKYPTEQSYGGRPQLRDLFPGVSNLC